MPQLQLKVSPSIALTRSRPLEFINTSWDTWLIGGVSIVFFLFVHMTIESSVSTTSIAITSYWLTFLINKPHFMLSYWLFYKEYRPQNLQNFRWWLASTVIPVTFLALVGIGLYRAELWPFQFLIHTMYFLVGWHYVKQVFGIMMFRSRYESYTLDPNLRSWLLGHLYSLWILNWLSWTRSDVKYDFFQIPYQGLHLPKELYQTTWLFFTISGVIVCGLIVKKYIELGERPPMSVAAPLFALYCWYIPSLYHPVYFLFIPLFHSLQYLVFAVSLRRNQIEQRIQSLSGKEWRKHFLLKMTFSGLFIVFAGWLSFEGLPEFLDQTRPYNQELLGTAVLTGAATLFINIHHYFIDAVLWRRDSPLLANKGVFQDV